MHQSAERPADGADDGGEFRFNLAQVELTSRCNLRCRSCLYAYFPGQWRERDLSPLILSRLLEEAPRIRAMHLQGWGESLLLTGCPDTVARIREEGCGVSLSSNGSLVDPFLARVLIRSGLDSMAFSLAGPSAPLHDAIRGEGSFARSLESITAFEQARRGRREPHLLVNYLLTPANIRYLSKVLGLAARLGVDTLVGTHLVHVCTPEQAQLAAYGKGKRYVWSCFFARLSVLWRRVGLVLPAMQARLRPVCDKDPLHNFFVSADGSISPCVYLCPPLAGEYPVFCGERPVMTSRLVMGSLAKSSLADIWEGADYRAFRAPFARRQELYEKTIPSLRTDFEGMKALEKAEARLKRAFAADTCLPPIPCRSCPHLQGF